MPSVSRKAVTNPMMVCSSVGFTRPARTMVTRYSTSTTPRPPSNRVLASMHELVRVGLRDVDGRASHFLHRGGEHLPDRIGAVGGHDAVWRAHRLRRGIFWASCRRFPAACASASTRAFG